MNRIFPLILILCLAAVGFAACGGSDDSKSSDSSQSAVLTAAALQKNLQAHGYGLKTSTKNQLPATIGSFAVDPAAGFQSSHYVTGKGLKEADGLSVSGVVTVLIFKDEASAKKAFDDLGGETVNRKLAGNRIYLWGGGTVDSQSSPALQQVIDASAA
jgi:hypothetical protein